jgi:hypothetical protein
MVALGGALQKCLQGATLDLPDSRRAVDKETAPCSDEAHLGVLEIDVELNFLVASHSPMRERSRRIAEH